jgi:hypothetical protein
MPATAIDQASYDLLDVELRRYYYGNRTFSTAMLAWFLEHVWRLDPEDASDSICDGGGDKGIDALYVDEDQFEITAFQAKHRTLASHHQGDGDLKSFIGVADYFADGAGVDALLASGPNDELRKVLIRLDVRAKLSAGQPYSVRLVFVTNAPLDVSGSSYVASRVERHPTLDVWDRPRLSGVAERTQSLSILDQDVSLATASG